MTLDDLAADYLRFRNRALTAPQSRLTAVKLFAREARELCLHPLNPDEYGDVFVTWLNLADRCRIDPIAAVAGKLEVVKARTYGPPDASGIYRRVGA